MDVALFVYGTLRQESVQRAIFGRAVESAPDALTGFALSTILIADPDVVATSGLASHLIARATGDPADRVHGLVLPLTQAELEAADAYETDDYARMKVRLESGIEAFVYAQAGEAH